MTTSDDVYQQRRNIMAEYLLEKLSDPLAGPAEDFMPTPYTNLPAFIEGAGDIVKRLKPPQEIVDRLAKGVEVANRLLEDLREDDEERWSSLPMGAGLPMPTRDDDD